MDKKDPLDKLIEEFTKFTDEFKSESDRAAVILGTAHLDEYLRKLIGAFLLPVRTGNDELLDGDRPLSTFSSRINLCFRMGLIDADIAKSLHIIRKIRNAFAHEVSGVTLEVGSHRDRINELVRPLSKTNIYKILLERNFDNKDNHVTEFRVAVALLSLRLHSALKRMDRISTSQITLLLPNDLNK